MKLYTLPARQQRMLALALLALTLLVAASLIALPAWWLHRRYDDSLAEMQAKLVRYLRVAGMRDDLQAQLQLLRGELASSNHYLKSSSPPLAAAEVQELVKGIIEAQGGKLNSLQVLPPKEEGRWRQIPVNVQLTATLGSLKNMLYALESARPYLFIDNLTVRTLTTFNPRAPVTEPELSVAFDLWGYAPKGATP
jgi:general secretion pathway protein M